MRFCSRLIYATIMAATFEATSGGAEFIPLGELSRPQAISDDGSTVVGRSGTDPGPLRWTRETGVEPLLDPEAAFHSGSAFGVSRDGSTIVGYYVSEISDEFHATNFRWTADEGVVSIGDLPGATPSQFPGVTWGGARGISPSGEIIVGQSPSLNEAFRWTESDGIVGLGELPGGTFFSSVAIDVSDNGRIVGWDTVDAPAGSDFLDTSEAFLWTSEAGMIGLGDLLGQGFQSRAHRISADGSTVIGLSRLEDTTEAFRWSEEEGMVGIGMLEGHANSEAYGVSANGETIVGSGGIVGTAADAAFIWTADEGMRNLQDLLSEDPAISDALTGWTLQRATDISADGRTFTGWGMNPAGNREGWVAVLSVPEPSGLPIMLITATSAVTLRRRWRRVG